MRPKLKILRRIAVIGGGTGTSRVVAGLKKHPVRISAITTTADDGGSSGILRRELDMVPPGDMRQCLGALASSSVWSKHLHARFARGPLRGHPLGNLVLALLYEKYGDAQRASDTAAALFGAEPHEVIPATLIPTVLVARLKNGRKIRGEYNITNARNIRGHLLGLSLLPKNVKANPRTLAALNRADAIIVGPGNFFSSILPPFLVPQIKDAFQKSRAKKIFIVNLMTQVGHTDNFTPRDFVRMIESYIGDGVFDVVLYNSREIPKEFWNTQGAGIPVHVGDKERRDPRFVAVPLANLRPYSADSADPLFHSRVPIRHKSSLVAKCILKFLKNRL